MYPYPGDWLAPTISPRLGQQEDHVMSSAQVYEYKVVTFRESLIGDALDSDKLEKVLNKHAEDAGASRPLPLPTSRAA